MTGSQRYTYIGGRDVYENERYTSTHRWKVDRQTTLRCRKVDKTGGRGLYSDGK